MAYIWDPALSTGIAIIDEQHKQLFDALNNIATAFVEGKGHDELLKTLDFLKNYTIKHFSDEEELQQKNNYPDYSSHKQLHDGFTATIEQIRQRLIKEGPSESLVVTLTTTVGNWLMHHIRVVDIQMATYIKKTAG